jgi:hypothetical protein
MIRHLSIFATAVVILSVTQNQSVLSAQETEAKPENAASSQTDMEKEFSDKMTGVTLVGYFTVDGQQKPPKEERYDIYKTTKLENGKWMIQARVKYGKNDLTVPVILNIDWAGDTPVMSLTDLTIPGLGTFTSRTMFYGDRYVGTWQHGKVGGHMYGRLEPTKEKATP